MTPLSIRFFSLFLAALFLSDHLAQGRPYVRRWAEQQEEEAQEDSPPLMPGLFPGVDDEADTTNSNSDDQGIRNGFAIAPLPWYAVFQSRTLCGASLIHGDILLTAAHCVDDNGLPEKVRVGANDYYTGGTVSKVIGGVLHPGWTWTRASDPDLAILVLEDFLPNPLAQVNSDPNIPVADHPSVFAMGFGLTNDKSTSRTLLGASIPYWDNCSSRSYTYNRTRHLCADSRDVATCGGDSGSPVMLSTTSDLQVGVNSYSNGKCSSQTLDVYTRVSFFYDWIQQQICENSANPPELCFTHPPTQAPTANITNAPTFVPTIQVTNVPTAAATYGATSGATIEDSNPPSIAATDAGTLDPAL